MALPYPEGEVFFKRSVLKNNDNGLDPDNLTSFNKHALVEWCWNESGGPRNARCTVKHRKGKHDESKSYAFHEAMIVLFGSKDGFEKKVGREDSDKRHDSRHSGIERMVKTNLPDSDEYERRAEGGPLMTALTPVEMDPKQPYMYIDLTFPIRAVYFPLAQKPSKVFPDLCSYLMVDFRLRQGVQMWDKPKIEAEVEAEVGAEEQPEQLPQSARALMKAMKKDGISAAEKESLQGALDMILEGWRSSKSPSIPMGFDLYAGLGVQPNSKSTGISRFSQTGYQITRTI
jgi:hypothetical protein